MGAEEAETKSEALTYMRLEAPWQAWQYLYVDSRRQCHRSGTWQIWNGGAVGLSRQL